MIASAPPPHGLAVREVGDDLIVLDERAGQVHQFNATASRVWKLRKNGKLPEEIAAALAAEFEVDYATALTDVEDVLGKFQKLNLIAPD